MRVRYVWQKKLQNCEKFIDEIFTYDEYQLDNLIISWIPYFCSMPSDENEVFMSWWERNREKERTSTRPFLIGLSTGFAIGAGVIVVLESGWYTRANMVANSRMSSVVLLLAILVISFFMAFFYRKFKWEMQEQRYLELRSAKNKRENTAGKQP